MSDVQEKPAIFERVNVDLGSRSYDILIGEVTLPQIAAYAARLAPARHSPSSPMRMSRARIVSRRCLARRSRNPA